MAERDSFPVSCDIKGLRGGKFPSLATTSSETLPASNRPRTPLSVIRRLTRLAPLGFAAAGLTSGSHAGARSWGLKPSGAIPFPGTDSVFSSFCAAISGSAEGASTARGAWPAGARADAAPSRFVPYLVGPTPLGPYHFRARIQSFQAFAAPFAGESARRCAPRAMGRFPRALRAQREGHSDALRRRNRDSDRVRARS